MSRTRRQTLRAEKGLEFEPLEIQNKILREQVDIFKGLLEDTEEECSYLRSKIKYMDTVSQVEKKRKKRRAVEEDDVLEEVFIGPCTCEEYIDTCLNDYLNNVVYKTSIIDTRKKKNKK